MVKSQGALNFRHELQQQRFPQTQNINAYSLVFYWLILIYYNVVMACVNAITDNICCQYGQPFATVLPCICLSKMLHVHQCLKESCRLLESVSNMYTHVYMYISQHTVIKWNTFAHCYKQVTIVVCFSHERRHQQLCDYKHGHSG